MNTKEWFIERIGKRVYRDATTCKCSVCSNVTENGLIIEDEAHAGYLYLCSEHIVYRDHK